MDPNELLFTVAETAGHARHITVTGELDVETSSSLASLGDRLVVEGIQLIVLDLAHVGFADSSGLRVLIALGDQLEAAGGSLVIEGMSPAVERLLEITGLINKYRSQGS